MFNPVFIAMSTKAGEFQDAFQEVLSKLSEKERLVIARRSGIEGERQTLQEIGESFAITRERVRQIEDAGIKKIGRIIRSTKLFQVHKAGEKILSLNGGLMVRDKLLSLIIQDLKLDSDVNQQVLEILLQSDFSIQKSKPQLGVTTYFYFPEIQKKLIQEIHKEAVKILQKKRDVMECMALYETIKANLAPVYGKVEIALINSVLDVFHDLIKGEGKYIGLSKWKILNPSTLKDKAIYVLKKNKTPLHFVEIANHIASYFAEPVKVATIHNELIRNTEFVLIGRGIYVLKEWGYKPGTVIDMILDVLKKNGGAMSTEDIIARVLKLRKVKKSTIYMNLQNRGHIERVGRNMYGLKKGLE